MSNNNHTIRTFLALPLPHHLQKEIYTFAQSLHSLPLRLVPPNQLHITLKFIGHTPTTKVPSIWEKVQPLLASTPTLQLQLNGITAFPNPQKPNVLCLQIQPQPTLQQLVHQLEQTLLNLGIPKNKRPFLPHITFARTKRKTQSKINLHQLLQNTHFSYQITLTQAILYQSQLQPKGAVYTPLFQTTLNSS
ncbi:MAG: RNA 2',3'-cyclic phosphodiesterase [Planctomycetota bacterium]|nr:MAG: RNA 2',3'-cyclic phosphodiesterase [Planctomycetota bacterium]